MTYGAHLGRYRASALGSGAPHRLPAAADRHQRPRRPQSRGHRQPARRGGCWQGLSDHPPARPDRARGTAVGSPAGIEPATHTYPSMRGGLTPPCSTSRGHTIAQVKGTVENREVRRREVRCGAVSGKSLARALDGRLYGTGGDGPVSTEPTTHRTWLVCHASRARISVPDISVQ
jgi:hypothetical protein